MSYAKEFGTDDLSSPTPPFAESRKKKKGVLTVGSIEGHVESDVLAWLQCPFAVAHL